MEISDRLLCLFSAEIERRDGSSVIEIPERELHLGDIDDRGTYRIAVLSTPDESIDRSEPEPDRNDEFSEPPVEKGEIRTVEIEDIGDQGDGITRVERGYVIIVPDTETKERVQIEITDVRENVAFGEVQKRVSYYE